MFNWTEPFWAEPLNQQLNPDVTVREKGVMEKCTFCIQRIRRAEERADAEGRDLETDEFTTACAQACPPKAIVWGDLNDPKSEVSKKWKDSRRFRLLEDLGTEPSVVYLKSVDEVQNA
jgi:molybdopterin-containing oxidoreductase family iron-sulfur binding subunit